MITDSIINLIKSVYTTGYVKFESYGLAYLYTGKRIIEMPRDITYALVVCRALVVASGEDIDRFRLSSELDGLPSSYINNPRFRQKYINGINELKYIKRELTIINVIDSR